MPEKITLKLMNLVKILLPKGFKSTHPPFLDFHVMQLKDKIAYCLISKVKKLRYCRRVTNKWYDSLRSVRYRMVELFRKIYHPKFVILVWRRHVAVQLKYNNMTAENLWKQLSRGPPASFWVGWLKMKKWAKLLFLGGKGGGLIGGVLSLEVSFRMPTSGVG